MEFKCEYTFDDEKEYWMGEIIDIHAYGTHFELRVSSRSSLIIIIGPSYAGHFACLPDFKVGCHLASLNDVLGIVNGITAANAIYEFDKYWSSDF
jgi:hypothetical protein